MDEQNGFLQGTPDYYYSFLHRFKLGTVYYSDDDVPLGVKGFIADGLDYWTIVTVPVEIPIMFTTLPRPVPVDVHEEDYQPLSSTYEQDEVLIETQHLHEPPAPEIREISPAQDQQAEERSGDVPPTRGTRGRNAHKRTAEQSTERGKVIKPRGRPPLKHPRRDPKIQCPSDTGKPPRKEVKFENFSVEYHRDNQAMIVGGRVVRFRVLT